MIDDDTGELNKYCLKLGQHYESIKEYPMAHRFYMQARIFSLNLCVVQAFINYLLF